MPGSPIDTISEQELHELQTFVTNLREQFNDKWMLNPESGCWLWTGYRNKSGYGRFNNEPAHRVSYRLHVSYVIPDKMELHHKCSVHHCVNPEHLELVTHAQNLAYAKEDYVRRVALGMEDDPGRWAAHLAMLGELGETKHINRGTTIEDLNAYQDTHNADPQVPAEASVFLNGVANREKLRGYN